MTKMMYAMAKNVVRPAIISTLMDDPAAVTPKNLSRPLTCFFCVTDDSSNTFVTAPMRLKTPPHYTTLPLEMPYLSQLFKNFVRKKEKTKKYAREVASL